MSKRPKIWVTQTWPRAKDSAEDFKALGLDTTVFPVLSVAFRDKNIALPSKDTCLIFTARNGVSAFVKRHSVMEFCQNKIICVGDATAGLARDNGFENVFSANGTASDVINWVIENCPKSQSLRHCAGKHVRGRIAETLTEQGYDVEQVEYYASKPIEQCNIEFGDLEYIAIYSPLGAQTCAKFLAQSDTQHVSVLSISMATDDALGELVFKKRLVSKSPDQAAMLSALHLDLNA